VTTVAALTRPSRSAVLLGELRKLPAFLRRDFLVAWSYRLSFVSEWAALLLQALMFYFVGLLVDPDKLPSFGGSRATYMEFVAVGIALAGFMQVALGRVAAGLRGEQLMGTLESLLMTPTASATMQVGTVLYDLVYIPLRTALFLVLIAVGFGLHFEASGFLPAAVVLLAFVPFVWGIGIATAGGILTFRRGAGFAAFGVTVLTLFSGAFFPLELLPGWASDLAGLNPITMVVDGMRQPLLGGTGWADTGRAVLVLLPLSAASLGAGIALFRLALRRERRRGSLSLY
jgi:ABC-2 type transport system permease protein